MHLRPPFGLSVLATLEAVNLKSYLPYGALSLMDKEIVAILTGYLIPRPPLRFSSFARTYYRYYSVRQIQHTIFKQIVYRIENTVRVAFYFIYLYNIFGQHKRKACIGDIKYLAAVAAKYNIYSNTSPISETSDAEITNSSSLANTDTERPNIIANIVQRILSILFSSYKSPL